MQNVFASSNVFLYPLSLTQVLLHLLSIFTHFSRFAGFHELQENLCERIHKSTTSRYARIKSRFVA